MTVPALVLAAGLGSRYAAAGGEGPKVLLPLGGRPLLAHAVTCALAAGCTSTTVVLHPDLVDTPAVTALLGDRNGPAMVRTVVNPHPADGIGASLAVGLAALVAHDASAEACVVLLADQPGVDPAVVAAVVDAWRRTGRPTRARYRDGDSHPVVLPRALWPQLLKAPGGAEHGARGLLATLDVMTVAVDAEVPHDVDRPDDLPAGTPAQPPADPPTAPRAAPRSPGGRS